MKHFSKYGLLIFCLVLVTSVVAQGQNNAAPAADQLKVEENQVLTPVEQKMQKLVSIDFRNTPMEDVIRILAQQADIDIVKSPNVVGNVTATLSNVPLGEALRNILAAHGYTYVADQSMLRVVTKAEVVDTQEALVNKVYQITFADVKEVEAALKKFISPRGSISANPGTNNIIVTDTESKVRAIDTFIDEVDRMTAQVLVEARIYDITNIDRFDIGVDWTAGRRTAYVGSGGLTSLGSTPAGKTEPFATGAFSGSNAKQTETADALLRVGFLNDSVDVDAIFRAEQEKIDAKLLANPRILVLDNETALIKIISELPYLQLNQGFGVQTFGTVEFKEVGVTLKVTPHVTREGLIRLKLEPTFSVQTGSANVGDPTSSEAQTFPVPIIDKREADTILLIKDGQTVVLGGLRRKTVVKNISQIPILGDLPCLGWLFKFTGEDTVLSEIVVFVTPRLIQQPIMTGDMNACEKEALNATGFNVPRPGVTQAERAAERGENCNVSRPDMTGAGSAENCNKQ